MTVQNKEENIIKNREEDYIFFSKTKNNNLTNLKILPQQIKKNIFFKVS